MTRHALLRSGLIFGVTAVCLTVAFYYFATPLLDLLLPWYRVELQFLMPAFHIDSLSARLDRNETVVALTATLGNYRVVLGRVIPPGVSINASTLAAHAWAPPVLMLALVASWPGIRLTHRPLLILLTLPFAGLVMLIQVPLMLWGAVEDALYWQIDPARVSESLGARVQGFLDGGGRYALALVLALLVVVWFRVVVLDKTAPLSPSPPGDAKKPHRNRRSGARRT